MAPTADRLVLRGRVVLPDGVLDDGLVAVEGSRIAWVGPVGDHQGYPHHREHPVPSPTDDVLLPGLVDLHCHGGGGAGFPDAVDAADARGAVREHLRHGTTSLVASLVTADRATLVRQTALLAELADAGDLAGIHLEGPFLSSARCGAQDPAHLVPGDGDLVREVARAARGHLVTMTVAPEVAGVLGDGGAVQALVDVGALPSVGHTDASAELTSATLREARRSLEAAGGRSARPTVTHLFNGMRPMHHRDPGAVAACLAAAARGDAVVELVADGVHLAPDTVRSVFDLVGPRSVALVTDAMAAAGMPDGLYRLGGQEVRVEGGVARLAGGTAGGALAGGTAGGALAEGTAGGALAGGTAHLIDVVRRTVAAGVPLADAVRAASATPAEVLGRTDVGALAAGRRADVVVVGPDLRPRRVLKDGRWVTPGASLLPLPLRAEARPGPLVPLAGARVHALGGAAPLADVVAARLARTLGAPPATTATAPAQADDVPEAGVVELRLVTDPSSWGLPPDVQADRAAESYRLRVAAGRAVVEAVALPGLLHGATTLEQLAAQSPAQAVEPVEVVDVPRFAWRGLSVDVARHPLPLPDLRTVVDLLVDLRLNVLHLHLTDDQGWRLEIPSRPLLTELSGGTAVNGDRGGFLSTADWADLVGYAQDRHVAVVPEIDLPGHVNAALHAYGELTPTGEAPPEYTGIEVGFSRLHADLPTTRPFLEDVLRDVVRLTPGRHVHIGGDEVLTMDREEYVRLVRMAADVVEAEGRTVVGWQEVANAPLTPGTVVQLWDDREDTGALVAAAAAGARILLSPGSRTYLDMKYDADTPLGLEWAGHIPVSRAYSWDPDDLVPGLDPDHVLGVEAAVWSETTRSLQELSSLLLPRLAAVAEVAWTAQDRRSWPSFAVRVRSLTAAWDAAGLPWYRSPEVW